jgi:hypothetical protein
MSGNEKSHINWIDEIIRETEHYYQGEQQQEERASWLLGTVCTFIAIIFSFSNFSQSIITERISNSLVAIILFLFLISAGFAVCAVIPFKGAKIFSKQSFLNEPIDQSIKTYEDFVMNKLRIDDDWSEKSYQDRLYFHHYIHYQRNLIKSRLVNWASVFLFFGLILTFFVATSIIL